MVRTGLLLSSCLLGACHSTAAQTEAPGPAQVVHPPSPPAGPTAANPPSTTPEPAWTPAPPERLCSLALEELGSEEPVLSCKVRWGELVEEGRIDLLEVEVDEEMTYITRAFLVLQAPGEKPSFEPMAEAYEVPGESTSYEITLAKVEGQVVRLRIVDTTTTVPNTGDPDSPSGEYDVTTLRTMICELADGSCVEADASPDGFAE